MTDAVNRFYNSIENASSENQATLVALFVYFLGPIYLASRVALRV